MKAVDGGPEIRARGSERVDSGAASYTAVPAGVTLPTSDWPSNMPSEPDGDCAVRCALERQTAKTKRRSENSERVKLPVMGNASTEFDLQIP